MQDLEFEKQIIEIINVDNNFKNIFEKEFEKLPYNLFNRVIDFSKELIKDCTKHNEKIINKMYNEYDIKNIVIYLTQEEYDELHINNNDFLSLFNIVINEIIPISEIKEFNKFSIRKQVFALENMNFNLNNNLKELETMKKS